MTVDNLQWWRDGRDLLYELATRDVGLPLLKHARSFDDELVGKEYLLACIDAFNGDAGALYELNKFIREPVDIRTFIEDPYYLNMKGQIYPKVIEELIAINGDPAIEECVCTGGISAAKTTVAVISITYQLYILSCLRDPHKEFDLDYSSEIFIVFQSIDKSTAKDIGYTRFRTLVEASPYFNEKFPFDESLKATTVFPNRIEVRPISGEVSGAIGQNVIFGLIDEVNFMAVVKGSAKATPGETTYNQAVELYNTVSKRRESRFTSRRSGLPGILFLVSSRNYPGQFTDKKEIEAKTNPRIYVYDYTSWEVAPHKFSGDMFRVFIGDGQRKPRIVGDDENILYDDNDLVLNVPVEFKDSFEFNIYKSITDHLGKSVLAVHPFIPAMERITACFGVVESGCYQNTVTSGEKIQLLKKNFKQKAKPRYAHIDLAVTGDAAGLGIGYVSEFVQVDRGDRAETLPVIVFDVLLQIVPPPGGEIEFEYIRRILYTIRDKLLVNIRWASCDSFQSTDTLQLLRNAGIKTGLRSVDKTTVPYDFFKAAIMDSRIKAPSHEIAQREVVSLEINKQKGKIDHPPNGSKDIADVMAAVTHGLTMLRENWAGINIEMVPQFVFNDGEGDAS